MNHVKKLIVSSLAVISVFAMPGCSATKHHQEDEVAQQRRMTEMNQKHQEMIQSVESVKSLVVDAQKSKSTTQRKAALVKAQSELQTIEDTMNRCHEMMEKKGGMNMGRCGGGAMEKK